MNPLNELSPHPVMFAPMVGISHFAVRKALQGFVPSESSVLWPTEMLSSRRLPYQKKNECPELLFHDVDKGLAPQLLGNEESFIRSSIERLKEWGAKAVDINMGCPVKRALQHNYGVALMGDANYAADVTEMAVKASSLPVSVKLRAGLQRDENYLLNFVEKVAEAGASWITLHPRTAEEKRRGSADWNQVKVVKRRLSIPVIGNGDLQCFEDIERAFAETRCDRVMIGRALLAKPWLLKWREGAEEPEPEAQWEALKEFLHVVLENLKFFYPEEVGLRKLRFLAWHAAGWIEFGHFLYVRLKSTLSYEAAFAALNGFFETPRRIFKRTELRR